MLEDLHWADPDTLDLVGYLAGAVTGTRVLLVADGPRRRRAAGRGAARRRPGRHRAAARPARRRRGRRPGRGLPGRRPAARPELHELVARSDGLPLLVEELLGAGAGPQVPPTFAGLVARRLAALPAAARPVVVAAAVVGATRTGGCSAR